jgi:glycosyltransferase involved in cell wall biosynthesis
MKRKILYIQHAGDIGGSVVSLLYTVQAIQQRNEYDVTILCKYKNISKYYKSHGINSLYSPFIGFFSHNTVSGFYKIAPIGLFRLATQLFFMPIHIINQVKIIKKLDPDIVHLNATVLLSSGIASYICHKPIVWHIREPLSDGYFGLRRKIISYIIKRLSNVVVAISPYDLSRLGEDTYNNMKIIYNFVDFNEFDRSKYDKTTEMTRLGLPEDSKVVTTLGGISEIKGSCEIVSSQRYFSDKENTYILIVGTNFESDESKELIDTLKSLFKRMIKPFYKFYIYKFEMALNTVDRDQVIILGRRTDIPNILAASDILVFGGTVPHFPRPIFEAWAMQKPVVAFDIDGVKQVVESGVDGILVKGTNPESLGIAINKVLDDKNLATKLATNGYKKAKMFFDRDTNIKQIIEIYTSI